MGEPHEQPTMADPADVQSSNGFTSVNPGIAQPEPIAGVKRKRDSKSQLKFYAVRIGKEPGICKSVSSKQSNLT